jgi:outer membrane protein OmpA-like peptidoglycan-associated protein
MIALLLGLISVASATDFCEVDDPGSAAFIRNEYVEFGIGSEGAFGEAGYPSGWHYRSNTGQLGFVANPQADGWVNYYGDFFSPGSPLEGWGVEVNGTAYDNTNGWTNDIAGSLGDPACEVDICGNTGGAVTWTGAVGDLGVETQYGVVNDEVYVVMTVTLTNNGSSTLSDVYWFRNVDPDNSVMTTYSYSTTNTIMSQPDSTTDLAEVKATGGDGADLYLIASDSRARVTHGGFYNNDASDIWSGSGFYSAVGDSAYDDAAISLAVSLGDMAPGQSETFRVIYALDETAVSSATDCAEAPVEPDADADGLADSVDSCPSDPLNDADGDGVCGDIDICEGYDDLVDGDGDYYPDDCDTCPLDALNDADGDSVCGDVDVCAGHSDLVDSDGDAIPDGCDACEFDPYNDADGDGVCGNNDICAGADDLLDTDADFTPDGCDACPFDALGDSDADGSCDSDDICPGADDALDTDVDGVPNGCDTCPDDSSDDSDGDGSCDSADICPGFDDLADMDGDGLSDDCDVCPLDELNDIDGDGVCGDVDICPSDALDDQDGDGLCESSDACPIDPENDADGDGGCGDVDACAYDADNDIDGDGICGDVDACPDDASNDADDDGFCGLVDNCPDTLNPDQADMDADGLGDVCDADADGDGADDATDNCPGLANDQADIDADGIGDACDPTDDRPADTGDTGNDDTASDDSGDTGIVVDTGDSGVVIDTGDSSDTSVDTDTDTSHETGVETDTEPGETDDTQPPAEEETKVKSGYSGGGCSATPGFGGLFATVTALLLATRRSKRKLLPILFFPLLMGASGGEVPEMSVVPLPPRGGSVFLGNETSIVGGVVTNPLSYQFENGDTVKVIDNTFWGWTTTRYTFEHLSFDWGIPGSIMQDGVPRLGDIWFGGRWFSKPFNGDGFGYYADAAVVLPTGTGLGVSNPSTVSTLEMGVEKQRGQFSGTAGLGYLIYPTIDLEGYELGSGPYLTAAGAYGIGDLSLGIDAQAYHNAGENLVTSLFTGATADWTVGNFSAGIAASHCIICEPGDAGWTLSAQITIGPDEEEAPAPVAPVPVAPPCECKSETVMEQPIVIVVPEKVDPAVPPKQEIGIGFKAGDTSLTPKAKATLDGVWVILNSRPNFGVKVVGYADAAEIEYKHPEELSYDRAKASADYLVSKGLPADRISVEGKGDAAPIDTSGTPEGRALNRRVEFVVVIVAKPAE